MRKLSVICIVIFGLGCNAPDKALKIERNKWHYNSWRQQFKEYTLCKCLLNGYGDLTMTNKIKVIDHSFSSPIYYAVFDSAVNVIIKPVTMKILADSARSVGVISENGAGKIVFSRCMEFYKSYRLDSLTNIQSKQWEKIKSIDSLIAKKVPSF